MIERQETNANLFSKWLSSHVPAGQLSDFFLCYSEIEKHGYKVRILKQPLLGTKDLGILAKLRSEIEQNRLFKFWHKKQMKKIGLAMTLYITFVKELLAKENISNNSNPNQPIYGDNHQVPNEIELSTTEDQPCDEIREKSVDPFPNTQSVQIDDNQLQTTNESIVSDQAADLMHVPHTEESNNSIDHEDIDVKPNKTTLRDSIISVLEENLLLSAEEIVKQIEENNLYTFKSNNSIGIVESTIRIQCKGLSVYPDDKCVFGCISKDEANREYYLITKEKEVFLHLNSDNDSKRIGTDPSQGSVGESIRKENNLVYDEQSIHDCSPQTTAASKPTLEKNSVSILPEGVNLSEGFKHVESSNDAGIIDESNSPNANPGEKLAEENHKSCKTIREAIIIVLSGKDILLSSTEIYNRIVAAGLFEFGAQNPVGVVYITLCRSCRDSSYTRMSNYAFGKVETPNKEKKFYLLSREKEVMNLLDTSTIDNSRDEAVETPSIFSFLSPESLSFTHPVSASYFGTVVSTALTWRQLFLDMLRVLYEDYPHLIGAIPNEKTHSSIRPLVVKGQDSKLFLSPGEFTEGLFVELNRSADDLMKNLKKIVDICNVDYENIIIKYERKQSVKASTTVGGVSHTISDELNTALEKTVSYLKTRYAVRLAYNHFNDPNHRTKDLLYKVSNGIKDVIWIYCIDSKRSHYISLETEPEYLASIKTPLNGFLRIQKRESHPCQKMFFRHYEDVSEELILICNSIDNFFGTKQITTNNTSQKNEGEIKERFYNYLHDEHHLADTTCKSYVSALNTIDIFVKIYRFANRDIITMDPSEAEQLMAGLLASDEFKEMDQKQHLRFSSALNYFVAFLHYTSKGSPSQMPDNNKSTKKVLDDFDKDKYIAVLLARFRGGMEFDSIDFDIFRETYSDMFDESIKFNDEELKQRLFLCGVYYKDRLFPAEGIIDTSTGNKLLAYIESMFASGKKLIYYKAIMSDLADDFSSCFGLADENMLRLYIEYSVPKGKYYFYSDYLSTERDVQVDHSSEISDYLLTTGKPLSKDEIYAGLPHITKEVIDAELRCNPVFLWNSKGCYFHIGIFDVSETELDTISTIIEEEIEQEGYALWHKVYEVIQGQLVVFLENNLYLSSLGIRNALSRKLGTQYKFDGAIISSNSAPLDMSGVYCMFAKHHRTFTDGELRQFSKEVGSNIYFGSIAEVSVRVNRTLFVAKDMVSFDVEAIDNAISTYLSEDYILIKEIDSFLVFPSTGYEWNKFLLESFLQNYSKKFKLLNNCYSINTVAGAVVKRSAINLDLVDVCADVLANSGIELKKDAALDYLVEANMIINKKYKDIDVALEKARRIRNRKR